MSIASLAVLGLLSALRPPLPLAGSPPPTSELSWRSGSLEAALAEAERRGTQVFAYFWSASSKQCAATWNDSLLDATAQDELERFVCFSVDIASADAAALLTRYNVMTLPTMLVLLPDGTADDALLGYHDANLLVGDLKRIQQGIDTVSDRRRASEAAPDDLTLRFNLAAKLTHVGAKDEAEAVYDSIIAADPDGETEVSARLQLWDVQRAIADAAADPTDVATFDLKPLYRHVRSVRPAIVVFEAWTWAIEIERGRGDRRKTLLAMRRAWDAVPTDQRLRWGVSTAFYHWENRAEMSAGARRFALEVAEQCVPLQEELDSEARAEGREREEYDVEPLDVLALCYLMNGSDDEARRTLERSVERNGASPERGRWLELIENGN